MEDIFVGRLMSSPVKTVSPDTKVHVAAETMLDEGIGSVVITDDDDGQLLGILTATDFVHIAAEQRWATDATVENYMTTDVTTTDANAEVRDIADLMIEEGFHHVPVVDDDEGVVGMITTTDITAYMSHVQTPSPS
ncbi:CBS domain-containing protein [Halorussus gelatinilyticus]|uniref:CBS domain-containing protein n=1 Tax=Halorussus gelatinilyticus TaxID=2937524 RepID=A0A8U0INH1_9EURY|nr:CBS domain-containing protein [Halorussus gelatinilyticus]UPW02116.1 CBS domain-containing protein [Halorussus gelatinilyticus]